MCVLTCTGDPGKEAAAGQPACRCGVQRGRQAEADADGGRDYPETPRAVHPPAQATEEGCRGAQRGLILSPGCYEQCIRLSKCLKVCAAHIVFLISGEVSMFWLGVVDASEVSNVLVIRFACYASEWEVEDPTTL